MIAGERQVLPTKCFCRGFDASQAPLATELINLSAYVIQGTQVCFSFLGSFEQSNIGVFGLYLSSVRNLPSTLINYVRASGANPPVDTFMASKAMMICHFSPSLINTLPLKEFTLPHDIAVSRNGKEIYVGEIGPNKIWKFKKTNK